MVTQFAYPNRSAIVRVAADRPDQRPVIKSAQT